ncbi:5-hydroxyisourate hydrolase [Aedes albopictus]|uniref:Transthyretin/hydroxyisourate hydrolase domain-containing protein n=1 Tax=Aedes albopictus TaxID=7160 RepID=A0ABM1ZBY3_AEDAL|nr:hypothetical protein RP20_CCG011230 [Aedes albopictus]
MSISVDIFDASTKKPAVNLKISLCRARGIASNGVVMSWDKLDEGVTDSKGHYKASSSGGDEGSTPFGNGQYKLTFKIGQYYEQLGTRSSHPYDEMRFEINDESRDFHSKLKLNPTAGLVRDE